jgi:hypothetical protein
MKTAAHRALIRVFIPACLIAGTFACRDIVDLKETPTTFVDPASYFRNGDEAIAAITGAYQPLMTWDNWINPAFLDMMCEEPDLFCPSWFGWGPLGAHSPDGSSWFAGRTWTANYAVIRRVNDVLGQLDKITIDPVLEERIRGEGHFLRAYAYFEIVRRYGPAPIRTTPYLPDGTYGDAPRAPAIDVYKVIVNDLKAASKELPVDYATKTYSNADRGRPTAAAAYGLLAKAYLHLAGAEFTGLDKRAYNDSAKAAALAVHATSPWVKLEPDFMLNFDWQRQINSNEILFQVGGTHQENTGMAVESFNPPDYHTAGGGGGGFTQMREPFYQTYEPNDRRVQPGYSIYAQWRESYSASDTGTQSWFEPATPDSIKAVTDWRNQVGWTWTDIGEFQGANKFRLASGTIVARVPRVFTLKYTDRTALTKSQNSVNAVILRYADVLLILAEAENELNGPTPLAYQAIDSVRIRAGLPALEVAQPGLTKDTFREAVWLERRHELYAEFQTWFDLKREGRWLDVMNNVVPPYPGASDPNWPTSRPRQAYQMILPLPSAELGANRLATQNPGY